MKHCVLEDSEVGVTELKKNLKKKYGLQVPYMRVFYGKQMALDNIYGKWTDSFQLLYTYKVEVEKASPGSVVNIDKHTLEYKIAGKTRKKSALGECLFLSKHAGRVF